MNHPRLAAVRTTRRSIAVAVFENTHLDYTQMRHLASTREKAEDSATGFVRWLLATFEVDTVALERVPEGDQSRRAILSHIVLETVRESGVSVWEVQKQALLEAFGVPALKTRKELRAIAASFWPILTERPDNELCLDAAILGLYVATERPFLT